MKKAIIYYQTGTGNTRIVSEMIADELRQKNIQVDLCEAVMPFDPLNPGEYDLVGFGYPIHAFNTPKFFLDFVRTLPSVDNIPAFIFKTSGEPFHYNDASSYTLTKILKHKGFHVVMDKHLLMPYYIIFRYPKEIAKQMYVKNLSLAKIIAMKMINKEYAKPRYYPWHVLLMYFFRLQWVGARLNRPLIKVDKEKCINCGICVNECPANTIQIVDGYPKFVNLCTMCMRCVMLCPKDAIKFGIFNRWKVSGKYDFIKLANDESIPGDYINPETKGYFKYFRKYYAKIEKEIEEYLNKS